MATQNPSRQLNGGRMATRKPNEESKGGEYHGGPKRWTGRGPPPARHIPWPEIFKHHISVIEGHKKMVDMVRKHTIEGSGNWRTIMGMVDRTNEMLKTSKQLQWSFVPPPNQREQVPLGVSSDSMYPGYSPADHEYGKAAEEYGKAVAEAKRRGVEIPKHPDIDYQIGQGKGIKRKNLAQIREMQQSQSGSGSGTGEEDGSSRKQKVNERLGSSELKTEETPAKDTDVQTEGDNPFFIIDTKPTPVNIPGHLTSPSKREADVEVDEGKASKKSKTKHSGDFPEAPQQTEQTEDISAEVDARMREKEERRKRKEERKRKRESEKSDGAVAAESAEPIAVASGGDGEKPEKKRYKLKHSANGSKMPDRTLEKKWAGGDGEGGSKKKKKKKTKE